MSKTSPKKRSKKGASEDNSAVRQDVRIDAAHPLGSQWEPTSLPSSCPTFALPALEKVSEGIAVLADIDSLPPVASSTEGLSSEAFRLQAAQLAERLQSRQKELDDRQTGLNSQIALLESDYRTARLWLQDKDAEIREWEEQIASRELMVKLREEEIAQNRELDDSGSDSRRMADLLEENREQKKAIKGFEEKNTELKTELKLLRAKWEALEAGKADELTAKIAAELHADFAAKQSALQQKSHELAVQTVNFEEAKQRFESQRRADELHWEEERREYERQKQEEVFQLRQREITLQQWESRLKEQAAAGVSVPRLEASAEATAATESDLQQDAAVRESIIKSWEETEARYSELQVDLAQMREQLDRERRQLHDDTHGRRQELLAEHRRAMAELDKKRAEVDRRSEWVDQKHLAVLQLREEMQNLHRETLEMRIATEELWAELVAETPQATVTQSIGRIRKKLADFYRQTQNELVEQKKELLDLRSQLVGQSEELTAQKEKIEKWFATRQEFLRQETDRLASAEEALKRREAVLDEQKQWWDVQRLDYEKQIRLLRLHSAQADHLEAIGGI